MKPITAFTVLILLLGATLWAGLSTMARTKAALENEMNRALTETLKQHQEGVITPDTIRTYRRLLHNPLLKEQAQLAYCLGEEHHAELCTQPMKWAKNANNVPVRGFANCSSLTLWKMADKRLPLSLASSALLWLLCCVAGVRKTGRSNMLAEAPQTVVSTCPDSSVAQAFPPQQAILLQLLCTAPQQRLSKTDICRALWPNKPYPDEGFYTLMKRFRQNLQRQGLYNLICVRGRYYQLVDLQKTAN